MRDDFAEEVKRTLAARVGNRCSNPNCLALTSGPQDDTAKALNVGVAAHITAAAQGGPRYDPRLSSEGRCHADNGIWLCQTCAKLVDNDTSQFPSDLLRAWKTIAEQEARYTIGKTASFDGRFCVAKTKHEKAALPATANSPNITWTSIFMQKLVRESDRLRPFVAYESAPIMFAYMIQVGNPAVFGRDVASAGQIKAQLRFELKQGVYDISPGAWVNEPFSSVRLDVGDQRSLILTVSDSFIYDWKMIANRRTTANDAVALDYSRDMPMQAEGSLEIDLVACELGKILQRYTMKIRWPWQSSLDFYGMKES